jgi:hypothetical protein
MSTARKTKKKYYTVEQANASLPLLKMIVRDITVLAQTLTEQHRRLNRLQEAPDPAPEAELDAVLADFESAQEQMHAYEQELKELQVEIKDYQTGLIDFPARMDGRDVYLCWRLGEPEVAHWHELNAGFAGRQKLKQVSNR